MQISQAAIQLRDMAEKQGAYYVLSQNYAGQTVSFPYYGRMEELSLL